MNKRICVLIMILALVLSGCQLAKPEAQAEAGNDMLVGVFVTAEHLDLFDFEAYFNDHANELISGGNTMIENTDGYQQRIYANMENGGCAFEGLDGIFHPILFAELNILYGKIESVFCKRYSVRNFAIPSSSLLLIVKSAASFTSSSALPMAIPRPHIFSIPTSGRSSPKEMILFGDRWQASHNFKIAFSLVASFFVNLYQSISANLIQSQLGNFCISVFAI